MLYKLSTTVMILHTLQHRPSLIYCIQFAINTVLVLFKACDICQDLERQVYNIPGTLQV